MCWLPLIVLLVMLPNAGGIWWPWHGPDGGLIILLVLAGLVMTTRRWAPGPGTIASTTTLGAARRPRPPRPSPRLSPRPPSAPATGARGLTSTRMARRRSRRSESGARSCSERIGEGPPAPGLALTIAADWPARGCLTFLAREVARVRRFGQHPAHPRRPHAGASDAPKRARRKSSIGWRVRPATARSAMISPTTEQNLKPCPENPAAMLTWG
jgi:hypothetical protein